jgi:hypothetical protein
MDPSEKMYISCVFVIVSLTEINGELQQGVQ